MKPAAGQPIKAARRPGGAAWLWKYPLNGEGIRALNPLNQCQTSPSGCLLFDWIVARLQMRNQLVKISKRSFFAQVASNGVMANLNNQWQNGGTAPWPSGGFFTSMRSVDRPQTSRRFSSKPRKVYWVIFAFWASLMLNCCSADQTNAPNDAVAFFKKAVNSEPDVERYSLSQFVAERKGTSYYVGARSGSNYFLQILSSSNELQNLSQRRLIVGRSGGRCV